MGKNKKKNKQDKQPKSEEPAKESTPSDIIPQPID